MTALAPIVKMPAAAAVAVVAETRAELAAAAAPAEVNRARLKAEALVGLFDAAVRSGAKALAEAHREAQILELDSAVALGDYGLLLAENEGPRLDRIKAIAKEVGLPPGTMRNHARLARSRRVKPLVFEALVLVALKEGKPLPLAKLRALGDPPKDDDDQDDEDEAKSDQIAVRLTPRARKALDDARGAKTRSEWVGELVVDAVDGEPLLRARRLAERAIAEAVRVDSAVARRAAKQLQEVAGFTLASVGEPT